MGGRGEGSEVWTCWSDLPLDPFDTGVVSFDINIIVNIHDIGIVRHCSHAIFNV